jgi:hypothetical protein
MLKKTFAVVVIVILCCSIVSAPNSQLDRSKTKVPDRPQTPSNFTTVILHLDDNSTIQTDASPNHQHGIAIGTNATEGVFGSARNFDGNDWIILENKNFSFGYNMSLSVFIKIDKYPADKYTIFSASQDTVTPVWLGINDTRIEFIVSNTTYHRYVLKSVDPVPLHRWTNIQAVYNGVDNFMGIYLDGKLCAGGNIPHALPPPANAPLPSNNSLCHLSNKTFYMSMSLLENATNQSANSFCISNLTNSTVTIGAVYQNTTQMFFDGAIDEFVTYNADVIYINYYYNNTYINTTNNNWWTVYNTTQTSQTLVFGFSILGILLFALIVGLLYSTGISVRSPAFAVLFALLIAILLTLSLIMVYPPISVSWSTLFYLAGFFSIALYVIIKKNVVDIFSPYVEQALPVLLIISLISFIFGTIDVYTGCLSLWYHPFWIK